MNHRLPHTYWVDGNQKKVGITRLAGVDVQASLGAGENVIGIVTARGPEAYSLDLGTHMRATFEFAYL